LIKLALGIFILGMGGMASIYIFKQINTNNTTELYKQGDILLQLQRYEYALAVYQKVVNIKPNHFQGCFSRRNTFITSRRYPEAIDSFKQVMKYNPNNYQAWYSLG
jgi:tetratricopeptide (TPR) repeat protein